MYKLVSLIFVALAPFAMATDLVKSSDPNIALTATIAESITVNLSTSTLTLPASGLSSTVAITGSWNLIPANHTSGVLASTYPVGGLTAALTGPTNVAAASLSASYDGTTAAPCSSADTYSINSGVADLCGAPYLIVSQTNLNTTPQGNITGQQVAYEFTPGDAPTVAGTYTGSMALVVYAP